MNYCIVTIFGTILMMYLFLTNLTDVTDDVHLLVVCSMFTSCMSPAASSYYLQLFYPAYNKNRRKMNVR